MSETDFYPVIFDIVNSHTRHKVLQRRFSSILQRAFQGEVTCPSQCAGLIVKFLGEDTAEENQKIKAVFSTAAADRIIVEHAQLFSDAAYEKNFRVSLESLTPLVNEMGRVIFKEKQHLGTVGALLAFGGTFASYCEAKEGLGVAAVETIVESVTHYFCRHVGSWLKTSGGVDMLQSARVECQAHFTESRKRKVNFSNSLKLVAEQNLQSENPQFYIEMCKLILELKHLLKVDTSETLFYYGMFLFGQEDFPAAKNALAKAIKGFNSLGLSINSPFLGHCHFQVGVIDSHLGNLQVAMVSFQKALEHKIMLGNENMSSVCHHWLGYLYRRMKQFGKAIQAQNRALQEMETNETDATSRRLSDSYFELGLLYHELGDFQNAANFLQKSLSICEEQVDHQDFKPKLQLYIHLAEVLYNRGVKYSRSFVASEQIAQIVSLLEKAAMLCKEMCDSGRLHDRFPVVILAHTDRLEKLKDMLSLALELCRNLFSLFGEKDNTAKQKIEEMQTDFENLWRTFVDADEQEQGSNSVDERLNRGEEGDQHQLAKGQNEEEKVVPPEIRARGRLALEAYNKALTEGMTCVKRVPIMLIGQDRSGKTSLKNSLRGKRFNRDEDSTVGIDVDPSHFKVSTELWKAGEKNEATDFDTALSCEHHAGRLAAEMLRQEKSVPEGNVRESTQSENVPMVDTAASNVNSDSISIPSNVPTTSSHSPVELSGVSTNPECNEMPQDTEPALTFSSQARSGKYGPHASARDKSNLTQWQKEDYPFLAPTVPEEIVMLIERLLKEVNHVEGDGEIYSVLWDFGGQSVYYATHPIFLTARAMYLLVYDLSRNPSEEAKPVVKQGMFRKYEDSFGTKTNLDYLDFWMTSVASLGNQTGNYEMSSHSEVLPEKLPPVFLVCTHADEPHGGGTSSRLAQDIFCSLQTKPYKTHLYDGVFAVNNTKSGPETECAEVARLRKEVLSVAKELPQMKETIPIKWLNYEKALQVTRKQGHKWITLESAKQIASEVCSVVDDQQFQTLLNFFHDQRILIHFDDTPELNKLVILDPQWLVDVFKRVITITPYCNQEKEFRELWFNLERTGILEEKLLKHLWGPLFDKKDTSENLIAIMEKFSLLCPWPSSDASCGKQYLVPSMLMSHPPEDIIKLVASAKIPSLFIKFESGQVPPGLFPRLMLQFFQWGREEFLSPVSPQLYHNFARFYRSGDEDCSVILLCNSSSIEIVHHRANANLELADSLQCRMNLSATLRHDTFDVTCARDVCRQVGLILESMRMEFCWLKNMKYDLCVMCPVCCQGGAVSFCRIHHAQGCKQEECLHFWSESKLRSAKHIVVCTKSAAAMSNKVQVKQLAPWFAHLGEQPAIDEHDGGQLEGSGEKSFDLPIKVVESLMSQWCDPKEIVSQLKEILQLDQASLEHPESGTKRLIRCLARKAKCSNRFDVVEHLREITPSGTTGPLLHEQLDVRNIPVSQRRELTIDLSSGNEWKVVAERLGLTPREIRFLDNRTLNPCDAALAFIANQRYTSVGSLYDVLNECGFPVIADIL